MGPHSVRAVAGKPPAAEELQDASGAAGSPLDVALALQRSAGNAATSQLLRRRRSLGHPTSRPARLPPLAADARREAWEFVGKELSALGRDLEAPLLAARGSAAPLPRVLSEQADRLAAGWEALDAGAPVPQADRAPFEESYGRELGDARIHTGSAAAETVTRTLGVEALTVGNHMVFAGVPSAGVLGHELAHVVQQGGRSASGNRRLRAAAPGSSVEVDAERASRTALAGLAYDVGPAGGEDLAMLAPLVWLAIAALVAGLGVGVAAEVSGPSYEENRRRAEHRHADDSVESWAHAVWLWVPVGGTASRIWEAQSAAERVFNIVMMPVDVLTLGAVGASFGKVANRALWSTALRQAGSAELEELTGAGVRAMTAAEVQSQARIALESGQAVIATVGRRNHALVFVKVGGRYFKLSGGALRSMRVTELAGGFSPTNINAFYAFGASAESAAMLTEAQQLARLIGPGVGFSFRSCGISAARLAEAGGLNLGLSGGRAYLPITVMGTLAEQGGVAMSQQGARRILGGTAFNYGLMMTTRGAATVASDPQDFASSIVHRLVSMPTAPQPVASSAAANTPLGPGIEVTQADIDAALDGSAGDDIALGDIAPAYLNLREHVEPQSGGGGDGGSSQQVTIVPVYSFIAAESDALAAAPPADLNQVADLTGAGVGDGADPRQVFELAGRTEYRDGAHRLQVALAGATDRATVLDHAHDYFPFTFATREQRDAATAALEREGVTGPELDRASAALAS
jgi:hypothetical protein